MQRLNLLSTLVQEISSGRLVKYRFLCAAGTLVLSSLACAATPLNDYELTNNFLSNEVTIAKIASARLIQEDYLKREFEDKQLTKIAAQAENIPSNLDPTVQQAFAIVSKSDDAESNDIIHVKKIIADVVKAKEISNAIVTLETNERKNILINNDPLFAFSILNEIALKDSNLEAYRLNGKTTLSYDLSTLNGYSYNENTGNYEFSNISGIVDVYVEVYDDDRAYNFRRLNYVF